MINKDFFSQVHNAPSSKMWKIELCFRNMKVKGEMLFFIAILLKKYLYPLNFFLVNCASVVVVGLFNLGHGWPWRIGIYILYLYSFHLYFNSMFTIHSYIFMRIIQAHIYLRTFIEYIKRKYNSKISAFLRDINSLLLYKNIVQKCTAY